MLRSRAGLGKAPKIETRHGDLIYVLSPCWLLPWVLQLDFYTLRGRCDGCAFEVNLKEIWTSACWWRTRPRSDASQVHEDTWGQANVSYENWQEHYPIISYLQLEPQRRSRWVSSLQLGMLWNKQLSLMTHVTQRSRSKAASSPELNLLGTQSATQPRLEPKLQCCNLTKLLKHQKLPLDIMTHI